MKKKICFIVASPLTAKAFLLKHFEYLSEYFDIYLVADFEGVDFESSYLKGTKSISIKRNITLTDDAAALMSLRKYLKSMHFDAVQTVTPKAGLIGIFAAKLAGIKVRTHIFTGQVWHTKTGLFKKILKTIDRLIVRAATHILVDGQSQRQFLIKNGIITDKNSAVLGKGSISGVDTSRFVPDSQIRNKERAELQVANKAVFLFLGRMNADKGLLDLAEAFAMHHKKYPESALVLVGPDEENITPKIKEICKSCIDAVVFYGHTSKPFEVLQAADVFCLPSYREGFGTSIIEASLLEIPIISSDTYGLMETIVEGETGLRHKVGDAIEISQRMEQMMDPELRQAMGKNARQYVLDNFSAEMISKEWVAFYKRILKL
ncbi:N,N'-diacetylbacillosaminyl-diphospho-undecapreno l alpha-1,3-N-acetylgalactosaminyltransferase [Flavobacterium noncentrifugens]|uniref:Glycosyltransferase involved in cell wall bisynthesis n=1 Tax=Flavobacterium noncentrifugens TaxID=1128970 RepID=A0A1G8V823_9FLAO|nr:glycosyltransferase [Flavobacterium noncentrifugens]GEP50381.1 N,N'-diacetylbacillosaminyl-diphospho-undecapreno l alpha-1,3-N-acetylgalactosaminyltransferase [Flavobacterium noncentrifugens]SDJ62163.1 Glycosyltransferase involved in cell wall bisynthesis [Flavobacterium noncentrifugens]